MEKQIENESGLNYSDSTAPITEGYQNMSFDELVDRLQCSRVECEQALESIAKDRESTLSQYPEVQELLERTQVAADQVKVATDAEQQNIVEAIKLRVMEVRATMKRGPVQAVYTAPKTTWDGKQLQGYAAAHPEILAFRKIGSPSVSIRWGATT